MQLVTEGKITQQGGASGQGCWFELKKIIDVATELSTEVDHGHGQKSEYIMGLTNFVTANPASHDPVLQKDIAHAMLLGAIAKSNK